VGQITGVSDQWSIAADGTFKTQGLLKTVIETYQAEKVETVAVTSPQVAITLAGRGTIENGTATVRFEDVDASFNDITSTTAPVFVVVTPSGPITLYVASRDHNGFTVEQIGGSDSAVDFDWMVTAYRKDFEPVVTVESPAEESPSAEASGDVPPPAEDPPLAEDPPVDDPLVVEEPASEEPAAAELPPAEDPPLAEDPPASEDPALEGDLVLIP
jgi:hypothetical protein